jgi:hypothetical protein
MALTLRAGSFLPRFPVDDSEAGTALAEYWLIRTSGFILKGQPFGGPGFKSVQIGLINHCKHRMLFSIPGYLGQQ